MGNTYSQHRTRLRKKFKESGIDAFHDYEKLELLLTYCLPRRDTKPIAKELLQKFKTLSGVFTADEDELISIKGIRERTALFFRLIKLIGLKIKHSELMERKNISRPSDIVDYYMTYYAHKKNEQFCIVYLNTQNQVLEMASQNEGSIDRVEVYIRPLIERIIKNGAKSIIVLHNHPGGSLKPSMDDKYLTFRLSMALRNVEATILDHIIIGSRGYFSFSEEGHMAEINDKIARIEKDYF